MVVRSMVRRLGFAMLVGALLTASAGSVLADPDVTAPVGTLTVGDGSGWVNSTTVPLHVDATDDIGVTHVTITLNGTLFDDVPYADTVFITVPQPNVQYSVYVAWWDAAGNGQGSEQVDFIVDTTVPNPGQLRFNDDLSSSDAVARITIIGPGGSSPVTHVRFRTGSGGWGLPVAADDPGSNPIIVHWPTLDPAFGGSPVLGPRTLQYQVRSAAGTWSAAVSKSYFVGFEDVELHVSGDVRTGHDVTFTPTVPAGATYPSGTVCWWELFWGDNQSIYDGERNSTFGSVTISGPPGKGYCDPWTVTLPWVPYRQFLVSFRADLNGVPIADVILGGDPDASDHVRPAVDSLSPRISRSSLPLVYVLPEDYHLILGVPTTYKAYAVAGATINATDVWSVQYVDTPERKYGGTSLTFVPRKTGHITVCWGSDEHRKYQISACYDPPVRRRDSTDPTTSSPNLRFGTGVAGDAVPVDVSWSGKDVGWGIASYRLQRSVDGGPWKSVSLPKVKSTSISQMLLIGTTYRYRIRATDKAANVGSWRYSSTFKPRHVADTSASPALVYRGAWSSVSDATALGGQIHEASAAGASVKLTFRGRAMVWIAERGPDHGSARVYIDGRYIRTVNLVNPTNDPRRIVFRQAWAGVGDHRIKIVLDGPADHPIVSLDGFAILR